mgnify:CR=1 FL=1
MEKFRQSIHDSHDIDCNQKYGDALPYSFHLKAVEAQGKKFLHLIDETTATNYDITRSNEVGVHTVVICALIAHDAMEDARFTYNNVVDTCNKFFHNIVAAKVVADIVYCVTDEKGKSRSERKNDKYYDTCIDCGKNFSYKQSFYKHKKYICKNKNNSEILNNSEINSL